MHTATVIGESVLDVVQTRAGQVAERPGGSPLNVAVTLARLGIRTELVTALGDDAPADVIERHLLESGVHLAAGARCLPATSSAVAQVRANGSAEYQFDIRWDLPTPAVEVNEVTHAGSLALFLEPGCDVVHDIVRRVSRTSLVSVDPNIRPDLLPDRDIVRVRFESLVAHAHVVKLSDEDAAWLYPGSAEIEVLSHLMASGPHLVALSRGSDGALLASSRGTVEVFAPGVDVADTIGAGDAFMGGLLSQLLERRLAAPLVAGRALSTRELTEVGSFAAKVAALTVARLGADPPYRHDIAAYERRLEA